MRNGIIYATLIPRGVGDEVARLLHQGLGGAPNCFQPLALSLVSAGAVASVVVADHRPALCMLLLFFSHRWCAARKRFQRDGCGSLMESVLAPLAHPADHVRCSPPLQSLAVVRSHEARAVPLASPRLAAVF